MNFELPLLYESFDRNRSRDNPSSLVTQEITERTEGPVGGTNYWVVEDRRPTEEQALDKIKQFEETRDDIVEFWENIPNEILDTESIDKNIPWWVIAPFYIAPYVAEELVKWDPLDRIQD